MRPVYRGLIALLLLSACATTDSLVELREVTPSTDPYHAALAGRYQQFAEEKVKSYDWWTSKYFADKGLLAAYGQEIGPEDPAHWNLDESVRDDFAVAHQRLLAALPTARVNNPLDAAAAVVHFDRWLELAEDGWNLPRIEGARDDFYAAMNVIGPEAAAAQPEVAGVETAPAEQASVPNAVVETTSTILYFPFDSEVMTDNTKASLNEMVDYIKNSGGASIAINGHADRAGDDTYNMQLSERRARLVMEALEAAGVPKAHIQYFAFGESDPKVATDDGVEEALNRRVEIFIE